MPTTREPNPSEQAPARRGDHSLTNLTATAAASASALFALQTHADAAIVYVDIADITLQPPQLVQHTTVIDVNGAAANGQFKFQVGFSAASGAITMLPLGSAGLGQYLTAGARMGRFAANAMIGPVAGSWRNTSGFLINGRPGSIFGNWAFGQTGFAGVRISLGNGNYNYGWIRMRTGGSSPFPSLAVPNSLVIFDFAYETQPNVPILAGAEGVPEPTSGALLALAALGAAAVRRKREPAESSSPSSS